MVKSLLHSSTMSDVYLLEDGGIEKHRGSRPGSETILEREHAVLSELKLDRIPSVKSFDAVRKVLTMTRIGTHDLSDVMHDVPLFVVPHIMREFFLDLSEIHAQRYVHWDIKPGNVMLYSGRNGVSHYAGIVDFGMALISNRRQNEPLQSAERHRHTHPTQSEKKHKELRAQPGQDWYAAARTMAHVLIGGSTGGFESQLKKHEAGGLLYDLRSKFNAAFLGNATSCTAVFDLLEYSLSSESAKESSLRRLLELGEEATQALKRHVPEHIPKDRGQLSFQSGAVERPKRHDVLLIIDNTGSMGPYVEQLKAAFDEIARLVQGMIDLRVDLWSLGDYSVDGEGQGAVHSLGERMRPDTFQQSLNAMQANREQHDEAEAYEVALQKAYLHSPRTFWAPRKSTTRSIVLVGDAYAHGWLEKHNPWGRVIVRAMGKWNPDTETRSNPDPKTKKKYDDFSRRHPHYMTREMRNKERDAYKAAYEQINFKDTKARHAGADHVFVDGEVNPHRPNYKTALQRCVVDKGATLHTIGSGSNPVSSGFLKYVAYEGNGTYTHVGEGELIIALKGIFASVDARIFREFERQTAEQNPTTQALSSITTFVIDSMSDEDI